MATVRIPPVLRPKTGGQAEVEAGGETVGEVLRSLTEAHPDTADQLFGADGELNRYVNVYLNDEDVRVLDGLDTAVKEGDTVVIPEDQSILLDVSPPPLFFLLVQGTLIWDRQDLTLDANYIYVAGGKMQIGTEEDPFLNRATITVHGDRYTSIELPILGSKVLGVSNRNIFSRPTAATPIQELGVLDIHGRPRLRVRASGRRRLARPRARAGGRCRPARSDLQLPRRPRQGQSRRGARCLRS